MKRTALLVFLVIFYVACLLVYWLGFNNVPLREGLYLATSGFATIAGVAALLNFGFSTNRSLTLLLLTAGIGYLFLGELLFNYYEYIVHIDPFPSIADLFYILAYPCLLLGLLNELKTSGINWARLDKPILFLFGLVALLLAVMIAYFGIYQAYDPAQSLLFNSVAMSYGIGDLLLILANLFLLVLVWEFRGGKFSRVWVIMFFSFICMLIADILFAIYAQQYTMQDSFIKSLLDSLWMLSYLLFGYGLFEFRFSIQEVYKTAVMKAPGQSTSNSPATNTNETPEEKKE
jgi:hypothetical protein